MTPEKAVHGHPPTATQLSYWPHSFRGNPAPGATPMRQSLAGALVAVALLSSPAAAQTIYPIDRADILVGAKFDLKVEFPALAKPDAVTVTINGEDYAKVLGRTATFIEREDGQDQSALLLRDVALT